MLRYSADIFPRVELGKGMSMGSKLVHDPLFFPCRVSTGVLTRIQLAFYATTLIYRDCPEAQRASQNKSVEGSA